MCDKCNGTGFVLAKNKTNNTDYAFRCPCPAANNKGITDRIETWGAKKALQYTTNFHQVYVPDARQVTADQGKKDEDDLPF